MALGKLKAIKWLKKYKAMSADTSSEIKEIEH